MTKHSEAELIEPLIATMEYTADFGRENAEVGQQNLEYTSQFGKFVNRLSEYLDDSVFDKYTATFEANDDRLNRMLEMMKADFGSIYFTSCDPQELLRRILGDSDADFTKPLCLSTANKEKYNV